MIPNEVTWAEKAGFAIKDWGYKVYYSYPMNQGKRSIKYGQVEEIDPETDLEACAALATHWYKRTADWCLRQLQDWHQFGIISHLGIRSAGKWVASCLTTRNLIRPSTAANYYIYSPDEESLIPLLSAAINHCCDQRIENLIADLVNEQRSFEPVYLKLGFSKVAEWARCELILAA